MRAASRVPVATTAPYDVVVGHDVLAELPGMLGVSVRRVAVIHPPNLSVAALAVRDYLAGLGLDAHVVEVPDGEQAKTSDTAGYCWAALGRAGFTRSDAVVSVGGGATTDLAGFVAATFLRGLRVVHIPTTLLAMVDAAVGGKTGINTAEGKNLVGAFHEPAGVLCDLARLETLTAGEMASGLAEVVKCGFIADAEILRLVERQPGQAADPGSGVLRELVERAIAVKAEVVAGDLREATSHGTAVGREALNYGHTLGHAIERVEHYTLRHGAAVAVGMVYVAELARLVGRLDSATVDRHRDVLGAVGLPTTYTGGGWEALHQAMAVDKKSRGNVLRFVIIEEVGRPAILEGLDPELLAEAFALL
ncbi:MAG: 3-dehydroquinate synthase [Nocardioidaceae bacterium]